MKVIVCGLARHGKDTFCENLGVPFKSSSMVALEEVIWPNWGKSRYLTMKECFEDRVNYREAWFNMIKDFNEDDPTALAKRIFKSCDVYCGLRNRQELAACKEQGLVDLVIWVDGSILFGHTEDVNSNNITRYDCDVIIGNGGSLEDLVAKARRIGKFIASPTGSNQAMITEWADSLFPDRTIMNAISKMVLEEIPEYLQAKHDPMELADLGILLYDIAHLAGVDLDDAIRKKMGINKRRKWTIDESTGLMKHIK